MFKKLYLLLFLIINAPSNIFGMESGNIQTAIKISLRKYQEAILALESMRTGTNKIPVTFVAIYRKILPEITKITDSDKVKKEIMRLAEEQYENITNNNVTLSPITDDVLIALYPEIAEQNKIMQKIYLFLTKKEYYQLIWQKLSAKENKMQTSTEKLENDFDLDFYN